MVITLSVCDISAIESYPCILTSQLSFCCILWQSMGRSLSTRLP